MSKVHLRLKLVLQLLISGKGANKVVKEHPSLKRKPILIDLPKIPDCKDIKGYMLSDENRDIDGEDVSDGNVDGMMTTEDMEKAFDTT